MVVLLQLDEDSGHDDPRRSHPHHPYIYDKHWQKRKDDPPTPPRDDDHDHDHDHDHNHHDHDARLLGADEPHNGLADILACYPVTISLVAHLDLNDLHALFRTSRRVRANLLQFRPQLLTRTLRCKNEEPPPPPPQETGFVETRDNDHHRWPNKRTWGAIPCARDLVAPCRRCGAVVCRNCTVKPPSNIKLPRRHRRLCGACQRAPLESISNCVPAPSSPSSILRAPTPSSTGHDEGEQSLAAATNACTAMRGQCTCASAGVFICQDCFAAQEAADVTYTRVWTWRSRYHSLGFGLGTGIGEGNEGVKCGRAERCLAARDIIVDMDCAEDGKATAVVVNERGSLIGFGATVFDVSGPGERLEENGEGDGGGGGTDAGDVQREESAGYYMQEVEGIGGVVKKKLKKRVRVGATVAEHEDEREMGGYLDRERVGATRSWCAWCNRVIPSVKDVDTLQAGGVPVLVQPHA